MTQPYDENEEKTLNIDALLLVTALETQYSTFGLHAEASVDILSDSRENLLELFDSEEELDNFINDASILAETTQVMAKDLRDKINNTLTGLSQ